MKINLIFDLDDTLVYCNYAYNNASAKCVKLLAEMTVPFTPNIEEFLKKYGEIELYNIKKYDFSNLSRFPNSWVETAEYFCNLYKIKFTDEYKKEIIDAANSFKVSGYILMPNVKETLEYFNSKKDKYNMIVLTMGDRIHQTNKLQYTGILKYFDDVCVVPFKSPKELKTLIVKKGYNKKNTYMIGNSKKVDIYPATKVGVNAIYVKSSSWKLDELVKLSCKNYTRIKDIKNLIPYLEKGDKHGTRQ